MKCKLCGKLSGISRVCIVCRTAIYDAALADGYTLADGVVMKPCERCGGEGSIIHHDPPCNNPEADWPPVQMRCTGCDGTGRVVAGGGGT